MNPYIHNETMYDKIVSKLVHNTIAKYTHKYVAAGCLLVSGKAAIEGSNMAANGNELAGAGALIVSAGMLIGSIICSNSAKVAQERVIDNKIYLELLAHSLEQKQH